jgi:anti-sigma B factor antagonist
MKIRRIGAINIIEPLDPVHRFDGLGDQMMDLSREGELRVLIDMRGISDLPKFAGGDLVVAAAALSRAGGTVKLMNVSAKLYDILEATRLTTVFEIFPDEQSAVQSFDNTFAARARAAASRTEFYWG